MSSKHKPWLSFAAPALILLALLGFLYRKGNDRVQVLPSVFIGIGLITNGCYLFQQKRKKLIFEINTKEPF